MSVFNFKEKIKAGLMEKYNVSPEKATVYQVHNVISDLVMADISEGWEKSSKIQNNGRRACYFSAEFLVGRAIQNNLLALGIEGEIKDALRELNISYDCLEDVEDAALGNGGLGRLAACFMESAATINVPLIGYGIRYKYGLFRQTIENGFQKEYPDDWTRNGDPWSVRCEKESVLVEFDDAKVMAVPYDIPVIGYKTKNIGTLRLWQAEVLDTDSKESIKKVKTISDVLYPNDNDRDGKILRLRQQYFFCYASLKDIIAKHKLENGSINDLSKKITIQLNDTHPAVSIPTLICILIKDEGLTFEEALKISKAIFNYTNHTIMPEALEKWDESIFKEILSEEFEIIEKIDEQCVEELKEKGASKSEISIMKIVNDSVVHMANLSMYVSRYVNGVAAIHTEILKDRVLKEWYKYYPERFQNKTNGITPRRWIKLCNPELSSLISELLGNDDWVNDLKQLKKLENLAENEAVISRFEEVKQIRKEKLAEYIRKHEGLKINSSSIYDIQIKRLHEYKRQLLNAFSILYIYNGIKDGSIKDFYPTTFIFGAKSAPGYARAKAIIKYINEIAKLISSDNEVSDLIKVVFVQNYNVSYAEKLVSGADVSEQISTAGTEASGTGNMKFMLNGTVTLGTYDGANVEIVEEAGEENNYIFGARVEQLNEIMADYDPEKVLKDNEKLKKVVETLIDGTFDDGGTGQFKELYDSLITGASWHEADNYYLLGDFDSYIKAKLSINKDFATNKTEFLSKCWINMCNAGKFSSDRTIDSYAKEIWDVSPIKL